MTCLWSPNTSFVVIWSNERATPFVQLLRSGQDIDCGRLSDVNFNLESWGTLSDCDFLLTTLSELQMTAQRVLWIHDTNSAIMATVLPQGMPVYNDDTGRWHVGDGATLGGQPMAKLSESLSIAELLALPTSAPSGGGLWWNGGVLSLS